MANQVAENRIALPLKEMYELSLLCPEYEPEDEILKLFQESIEEEISERAIAILDDEDRPYRFVFFSSPRREGLMLAVIDKSDPENQEIRFHDNAFWWWFFLIEVSWMLRDALE
jgi:hypothetical protein